MKQLVNRKTFRKVREEILWPEYFSPERTSLWMPLNVSTKSPAWIFKPLWIYSKYISIMAPWDLQGRADWHGVCQVFRDISNKTQMRNHYSASSKYITKLLKTWMRGSYVFSVVHFHKLLTMFLQSLWDCAYGDRKPILINSDCIALYFKQISVSLLSYGHRTTLLKRAMLEKQERASRTRAKMLGSSPKTTKGKKEKKRKKKLFTHPSFLIAPLKHSTNETYCWKESCKEIKIKKIMLFTM